MNALNKKIASFYKLLANRNRFLNKEVQRLHFFGSADYAIRLWPGLIVVKLSWNDQVRVKWLMNINIRSSMIWADLASIQQKTYLVVNFLHTYTQDISIKASSVLHLQKPSGT